MTRLAYLGNFSVPFATEVHVAASLESLGHEVVRIQEGETKALDVPALVKGSDLFLHTCTYGYAVTSGSIEERFEASERIAAMGVPRVFFHLDKWMGLPRSEQLSVEPHFRYDHVFTADGGHDDEFRALGINHVWSPPAVYHAECEPGTRRQRWASDIAFVGNWRGGYHPEATHRAQLIAHLRSRWRKQVRFHPRGPAVRGADLRDLFASVKVVVGDSCLLPGDTRYCSDRVFETIGRGGFLIHPHVAGVFPELLEDGKHLRTWTLGDWDELDRLIAYYLAHADERREIAERGRAEVLARHTYVHRMQRVLETVFAEVAA